MEAEEKKREKHTFRVLFANIDNVGVLCGLGQAEPNVEERKRHGNAHDQTMFLPYFVFGMRNQCVRLFATADAINIFFTLAMCETPIRTIDI